MDGAVHRTFAAGATDGGISASCCFTVRDTCSCCPGCPDACGHLWLRIDRTGPLIVGDVRFDVNTMLFCAAATVIGSQLILFWTFAEIFALGEGLVPPIPRLMAAFSYIKLELGLAVGG